MKFATIFVVLAVLALGAFAQEKPKLPHSYSFTSEVFFHDGTNAHQGTGWAALDDTKRFAEISLFHTPGSEINNYHIVGDFVLDKIWASLNGICEVGEITDEDVPNPWEFLADAKFAGRRVAPDGKVLHNWIHIDEVTGLTTMGSFEAATGVPVEVTSSVPQTRIFASQIIHSWHVGTPDDESFKIPDSCKEDSNKQREIYW